MSYVKYAYEHMFCVHVMYTKHTGYNFIMWGVHGFVCGDVSWYDQQEFHQFFAWDVDQWFNISVPVVDVQETWNKLSVYKLQKFVTL